MKGGPASDIPKVNLERPRALAARVVEGKEGIRAGSTCGSRSIAGRTVVPNCSCGPWQGEAWMDQEIMSAEQAKGYCQVGGSGPNIMEFERTPSTTSCGRIRLGALNLTIPFGRIDNGAGRQWAW